MQLPEHTAPSSPMLVAALRGLGAAVALLALQSCGGGDGETAGGAANAVAANKSQSSSAGCTAPDFSAEVLQLVNARRASGAVCGARGSFPNAVALRWNNLLTDAARAHSQDMAAQNYFAHAGLDGRSPGDRILAAGYDWLTYGENIAAGYASVQAVVDAWFASDGHCENLMNGSFRDIGVACVPGNGSTKYANYWSMELGAAR